MIGLWKGWLTFLTHELYLQGDPKANEVTNEELKSETKATNFPGDKLGDTDTQMIDQLPQVQTIGMILFLFIVCFVSRSDNNSYLVCIR